MTSGGAAIDAPHRRVTLGEVRAPRNEIYRIAARRGVRSVRVFGSVARDEADENSDLDLLIEMEPGRGYFDMSGFALDVEALLNGFTQVATPHGIKARIRDRVLAEAVPV
jgi:uncharacterized protein